MTGKDIADYGIPIGITTALALFIAKRLWPFFKTQYERQALELDASHKLNQKLTADFLEALGRRDQEFTKVVESMDRLALNVARLTNRIELLTDSAQES